MAVVAHENVLERLVQHSKGAYAPWPAQVARVALLFSIIAVGMVAGLSLTGMISMWWAILPAVAIVGAVVINVIPAGTDATARSHHA